LYTLAIGDPDLALALRRLPMRVMGNSRLRECVILNENL